MPTALFGGEEGGTLSPFAYGTGARALSLGGSCVALPGGAASLVWNPASAAAEGTKQLSLFYTSPYVEGNRYTFAGYIHPLLDLGTIGFANLRYALDDISKYDSDGAPLGAFSNVQNEWLLSYALPPIGKAHFGASLKVETHSLDNQSASAIGADIGFLYFTQTKNRSMWSADNFGFGMAIRNVVEPRLTLESVEETLPMLIRTGFSYTIPFRRGPADRVILLSSLEQGNSTTAGASFGVETVLAYDLAIRFGSRSNEWAGGIGLPLKGGRLDYSLGMQEMGAAHRLEFTLAFGSSLESRRMERARQEEEQLVERTQAEMEKNERNQIASHIANGREEMKGGNWMEAENWFERALLWDPDGETARELLAKSRYEKHLAEGENHLAAGRLIDAIAELRLAISTGVEDPRATDRMNEANSLVDRTTERSRTINDKMTRGIELLAVGDFTEARGAFEEALAIDPNDGDAARFLDRTDSLLTVRVDRILEEASQAKRRNDFSSARAKYREALALEPGREDLVSELRNIDRNESTGGAEEKVVVKTPPAQTIARRILSSAEQEEVARMYRLGFDQFRRQKSGESIHYFEFVYNLDPQYKKVVSYLAQAYLFVGMEHYTNGRIREAIGVWEKILVVDPDDEKALSYLRRGRLALHKARELGEK